MSSKGSSSPPRRGNTAGGKEDRPRLFGTAAKAKCWANAEVVPGRHPERWRKDAAGNIVCKRFANCQGCLCFEYDHITPYSKGMSKSSFRPPPFTEDEEEIVVTGTTRGNPKEPLLKRPRNEAPPPAKTNPNPFGTAPNAVSQAFARLGHAHVSEPEISSWASSSHEENNDAITKLLCEAFFRQASHHKDIKGLAAAKDKADKEALVWKFKAEQVAEDARKLAEAQKVELQQQTWALRDELREAKRKLKEVEKARAAEKEELETRVATLESEQLTKVGEAKVEGQVKFMKSFMRKLPDFDWGLLGAATKAYAEKLRAEMAEEAKKRAEEAEAQARNNAAP